jgi:hypothetical protein
MKKLIFTLSLFCTIAIQSNAQYCGGSGPSVCTPAQLAKPGLSPVSDSLAPIIDNVANVTVIEFQNYDTLTFSGQSLTMDSLTVDTISNLPQGFCWTTNSATNTWGNQQNGCIKVAGTTTATPGQYKLHIIVTAYTNLPFPVTTSADAAGLYYYVRVDCTDSSVVHPVDTTQTEANPFIPYTPNGCAVQGIATIDQNIESLSVFPNPMSSQAQVSFSSAKAGMMTEKMTSIIGTEVYSQQVEVKVGVNTHTITRNSLAAGVYFYTINDGISNFTKRIVIE